MFIFNSYKVRNPIHLQKMGLKGGGDKTNANAVWYGHLLECWKSEFKLSSSIPISSFVAWLGRLRGWVLTNQIPY